MSNFWNSRTGVRIYNAYDYARWLLAHVPWAFGIAWDAVREHVPRIWGFVRGKAWQGLCTIGRGVLWCRKYAAAGFWYLFDRIPDSFFGIPKHLQAQRVQRQVVPPPEERPHVEAPRDNEESPPPMEGEPRITVVTYPDDRSGPEYRHFDIGVRVGSSSSHAFHDGVLYDGYPRRPAPLVPQRIMERLMAMDEVTYVGYLGNDVTVRIQNDNAWDEVEPRVFAAFADALRWTEEPFISRAEHHYDRCEHGLAGQRVPIAA